MSMKSTTQILTRIRKYVALSGWVLAFLDSVVSLLLGGYIGTAISGSPNYMWISILFVGYILLSVHRFITQNILPSSLIGEIVSASTVDTVQKESYRRTSLFSSISDSIEYLNRQTCEISYDGKSKTICSEQVSIGLSKVLGSMVSRPQHIFDCDDYSFSIFAAIHYFSIDNNSIVHSVINLRDDFDIVDNIKNNLLHDNTAIGTAFDIGKIAQKCFRENKLIIDSIPLSSSKLRVIASPIPLVCEDGGAEGVILFIMQYRDDIPSDIDYTLKIYGRITANWLNKYSECAEEQAKRRSARSRIPAPLPGPNQRKKAD